MEDISINSMGENVVLPARKIVRPKVVKQKEETNNKSASSNNDSGKKERISVDLERTVVRVKEFAKTFTTKLSFSVDPKSKEAIIYVKEKDTGKVIRQIPAEDIQKMTDRMNEIVGILYNRRA